MADKDGDLLLSDAELNEFQTAVFGQNLTADELADIKECVRSGCESGIVPGKGITESGFQYLNKLFIERGRMETTWSVLKRFGYDEKLDLIVNYSIVDKNEGARFYLSDEARSFVESLFARLDLDEDKHLNDDELQFFFDLLPFNPWESFSFPDNVEVDENGNVGLPGFLCQWQAFAHLDPAQCLYTLKYLGFTSEECAFKVVSKSTAQSRLAASSKPFYRVVFLGTDGSGKSSILRTFLNRQFDDSYLPTEDSGHSVIVNAFFKGQEKTVMFEEYGPNNGAEEILEIGKAFFDDVDLLCFIFDQSNPHSFDYISSLRVLELLINKM